MEKELIQLELPFDAVIDYQEAEQENYKVLENIHLQAIINSQEFLCKQQCNRKRARR